MRTAALTTILIPALLASAALAQAPPSPPPAAEPPPVEVEEPTLQGWADEPAPAGPAAAQPISPGDAHAWWSRRERSPPDEKDPLHGRRASRDELARAPQINSNADPLLYRLWGLQPLHIQAVRRGELILEVWIRPQTTVRQAVIRAIVRDDGRAFVQARAGLGCCDPEIGRRVDIDAALAPGYAAALRRLAADPAWSQPENVSVDEGGGAVEGLCVGGQSYDLMLVEPDRAVHLRRACGGPELGSVADILSLVIGSALGKDARFDALFPRGADFASHKAAYADLLAQGGRLLPKRVRTGAPAGSSSIPNR